MGTLPLLELPVTLAGDAFPLPPLLDPAVPVALDAEFELVARIGGVDGVPPPPPAAPLIVMRLGVCG